MATIQQTNQNAIEVLQRALQDNNKAQTCLWIAVATGVALAVGMVFTFCFWLFPLGLIPAGLILLKGGEFACHMSNEKAVLQGQQTRWERALEVLKRAPDFKLEETQGQNNDSKAAHIASQLEAWIDTDPPLQLADLKPQPDAGALPPGMSEEEAFVTLANRS
jgi:hypothetical protein